MTQKAQIGKNIWNDELARARIEMEKIRRALDELSEDPGPQTRGMLIAKVANAAGHVEAALSQLERIGRDAKTGTLKNT